MNNLIMKGNQNFMGVNVPIIEGGFGEGKRCMLAKTVAEVHGVKLKDLNRLINNNRDEFDDGIDILDLKLNGDLKSPLLKLGFSDRDISISKNIYLLSEQGYILLTMLMKTPKAKEIRKRFVREYFTMKEVIQQNNTQLQLSDDIKKELNDFKNDVNYIRQNVHIKKVDSNVFVKQIKTYLGINRISEDKYAYDLIKNSFLTTLGVKKFEDVTVNADNLFLLNDCCKRYKRDWKQLSW